PTSRPARTEPVKATLRTSRWATSGAPASSPVPVTTFTTPGGRPHSSTAIRASSRSDAGVNSDGLATTVFPAASARPVPRPACVGGGGDPGSGWVEGGVPGEDPADHAEGRAAGVGMVAGAEVDRSPLERVHEPAVELEVLRRDLDLPRRVGRRLTGLEALERD